MAKHVGIKLPDDLITLLQKEKTVATLATFSEKGLPHATPVHTIYPKSGDSILMTIHKESVGYHNMVWQKKVMLSFLGKDNIAYGVLGRAGVVRAPSQVHPLMNVVRIDVIDVVSDKSVLINVDSGVAWSYSSVEAEELGVALMNELKELVKTL